MRKQGKLTIIFGCMFAGKTTRLIAIIQELIANGKKVEIFHPEIDTRYGLNAITSHEGVVLKSRALSLDTFHITEGDMQVAVIDETHFFRENCYTVIAELLREGVDVYIGALNKDYLGHPFPIVEKLLPLAREIEQLYARCSICGQSADFSYRTSGATSLFVVGGAESYEPRCALHFSL